MRVTRRSRKFSARIVFLFQVVCFDAPAVPLTVRGGLFYGDFRTMESFSDSLVLRRFAEFVFEMINRVIEGCRIFTVNGHEWKRGCSGSV